jgi:predicted PurR-regulated permease PerM
MREKVDLNIPIWTIVKIVLVVILFYLLFLIRDILALLFIVLILVATFSPVVADWSKKIGRPLAVLAIVVIFLALLGLGIYIVIPPMVEQIVDLTKTLPSNFSKYEFIKGYLPAIQNNLSTVSSAAGNITGGVVSITTNVLGGFVTFIAAIVLFIYLLIDEKALKYFVLSFFPDDHRENMADIFRKVASKVGDWFRGQLLLAFIVGVVSLIGLLIIGVPYALTLAVISGVLDIVPTLGPVIAGVLAAAIALTDSPIKALIVVIFYVIIQQLESNILVPKVMQKAVGLSPVIIIIAILIGARLLGIVGAIIAVPLAASLIVVLSEWSSIRKYLGADD